MTQHLVLLLVFGFGIAAGLTPALRNVAIRLRLLDVACDSRRVHCRAVPRLGGAAIVAGTYGALVGGLLLPETRAAILHDGWSILAVLLAGALVATAGLYDDVMGARATKKLAVELAAAAVLWAAGFRIETLDSPFGGDVALGILSLPVTLLWIAGVANAVNLVDGLDGLAGGVALFAAAAVCLMGARAGDVTTVALALAMGGAVLGFLVYNVHPASIFMGDVGSLFLGTVLAALPLRARDPSGATPVVAMAIVLAFPLTDMAVAVARRASRGTPVFSADRQHLHHRLVDRGLSHRRAVTLLWATSAVLATVGVNAAAAGADLRGAVFGVVILAGLVALTLLGSFRLPDAAALQTRRRNRARLRGVRRVTDGLRAAGSVADVYRAARLSAAVFGARAVRLCGPGAAAAGPRDDEATARHRSAHRLEPSDPRSRVLEFDWGYARILDRDTEVAIEVLCRKLSTALQRVERRSPPLADAPRATTRRPSRRASAEGPLEEAPPVFH